MKTIPNYSHRQDIDPDFFSVLEKINSFAFRDEETKIHVKHYLYYLFIGKNVHKPDECESPIEISWDKYFEKYGVRTIKPMRQFWCKTNIGNFRIDFVYEVNGRKIGIECDGKDFHSKEKDQPRDKAIIESGCVDVIYRFKGKDIRYNIDECFLILWGLEPSLLNRNAGWVCHCNCYRSDNEYSIVKSLRDKIFTSISRRIRLEDQDENPFLHVYVDYIGKPEREFCPFYIFEENRSRTKSDFGDKIPIKIKTINLADCFNPFRDSSLLESLKLDSPLP